MDISSKINSIEGNNKKIDEKINLANISKDNNKVKEALKEGKHLLGNNNLLVLININITLNYIYIL